MIFCKGRKCIFGSMFTVCSQKGILMSPLVVTPHTTWAAPRLWSCLTAEKGTSLESDCLHSIWKAFLLFIGLNLLFIEREVHTAVLNICDEDFLGASENKACNYILHRENGYVFAGISLIQWFANTSTIEAHGTAVVAHFSSTIWKIMPGLNMKTEKEQGCLMLIINH